MICKSIFEFKCKGFTTGITSDGQNFWIVDTGYIYKVSPTGVFLDSLENPAPSFLSINLKGGDITYDGSSLWYADEQSAMLIKINPATKTILQQYPLPGYNTFDPNGFGITWDGANLWFVRYDPPILYKINPANGTVLDSVAMVDTTYTIEYVNGIMYGLGDNTFYKINTTNGSVGSTMDWCVPYGIGLAWDGNSFWNISGPSEIFGEATEGDGKAHKLDGLVLAVDQHVNESEVSLFPNPASAKLVIKGKQMEAIEIYSVTGSKVYSKMNISNSASTEVNVSELYKGVYFVKVYAQSGTSTKKLVVE